MTSFRLILVIFVCFVMTLAFQASAQAEDDSLTLKSSAAVIMDQSTGAVLYEKNSHLQLPIASITKLMTAMVMLDSNPYLNRPVMITEEDIRLAAP